jgi:hypothetical protein
LRLGHEADNLSPVKNINHYETLDYSLRIGWIYEARDSFYDELETVVIGCPRSNIKIPLGGLNAKIWFEDQDRSSDGN